MRKQGVFIVSADDTRTGSAPAGGAVSAANGDQGGSGGVPATASSSISSSEASPQKPKKSGGKAKRIFLVLALIGLAAGTYEGHAWWTHGRFMETTDDAYVDTDITVVLSKVSGYVASIKAVDNAPVKAGDVLLRIDDGDYRLAVEAARDSLASAKAAVARISEQVIASQASVREAEAGVLVAQATREDAELIFQRREKLTKNNVVSQATLDTARTDRKAADANVEKARAAVELAKANVAVLESQKNEAETSVKSAETALEKAERDLGFTVVRAPVDGIFGNRAAQVGSFLQAGSRLAAIVPLKSAHVEANFKETQLGGIAEGGDVTFTVDAYPDVVMRGKVESISPATGSVFSLLPPENATGNFTKVVQRVPVKILVDAHDAADHPLRAGMSVIVEVDTRTGGRLAGADGSSIADRR
jgi:membrane fusion protein (multidrug efflux system)